MTSGFRGRKLGSLSGPPVSAQAPGAQDEVAEVPWYFRPLAHGVSARDSPALPVSFSSSSTSPWVRLPRLETLCVCGPRRALSFISLLILGSSCVLLGASGAMSRFVCVQRCPCLSVVVFACLWVSVCCRVSLVFSLGLRVSCWVSVCVRGQVWVSVGVGPTSCWFPCASVGVSRSLRVSPRLSGSYRRFVSLRGAPCVAVLLLVLRASSLDARGHRFGLSRSACAFVFLRACLCVCVGQRVSPSVSPRVSRGACLCRGLCRSVTGVVCQ